MGADLYLKTVLDACHERYGRVHQLMYEAIRLAQGDMRHTLYHEGQSLKAALFLYAQQTGIMETAVFDGVAEITDIAQGENAVWTVALAEQIVVLIRQIDGKAKEEGEAVGESGAAHLAYDLLELLKGHQEAAITHGVTWIAQQLATAEQQATSEKEEQAHTLANLSRSMVELLQGDPRRALALLVERQIIPQIERACADQADCLHDLTNALDLISPSASSSWEADFTPSKALVQWSDLVRRFHETISTLQTKLAKTLHLPVFEGALVTLHLMMARTRLGILKHDGEMLLPQMEAAMKTLGSLLMRTLPPDFAQERANSTEAVSPSQTPSPLRQVLGTIPRHQAMCDEVIYLIDQCIHMTQQVLGGKIVPALLEVCQGMVTFLYTDAQKIQTNELEIPLSRTIAESISSSIPLAPGVLLLPGTLMDMCYMHMLAAVRQSQHQQRIQEWIHDTLANEQTAARIILSFWQLLLGEPNQWAILLAELIQEMLTRQTDPTPEREQAISLVRHLQDILREQPAQRLQVLLTELRTKTPSASPLAGPIERLLQLARGQISAHVTEAFWKLSNEVQQHPDWPEERIRDLQWLLDLGSALLPTAEGPHAHLLLATLSRLCADFREVPSCDAEGALCVRLAQLLGSFNDEEVFLHKIHPLLENLPELGPLSPNTDPRLTPSWHFRLLRDLIAQELRLAEESAEPTMEQNLSRVRPEAFPLLVQVLEVIQRMLHAWLFPESGYFRDPYNDTSTLWVATSAFWPAIADQITEPLDEQSQNDAFWFASNITAQIPLSRIRELIDLLTGSDVCLPSKEHLARWGHVIRVDETGPYSLNAWHSYFGQRRSTLLTFLEAAIACDEPILCSL